MKYKYKIYKTIVKTIMLQDIILRLENPLVDQVKVLVF